MMKVCSCLLSIGAAMYKKVLSVALKQSTVSISKCRAVARD
jgi:hypothetical protein